MSIGKVLQLCYFITGGLQHQTATEAQSKTKNLSPSRTNASPLQTDDNPNSLGATNTSHKEQVHAQVMLIYHLN